MSHIYFIFVHVCLCLFIRLTVLNINDKRYTIFRKYQAWIMKKTIILSNILTEHSLGK